MLSLGIMLTVVTHSSTDASRVLINGVIEVTACRMVIATALLTRIGLLTKGRLPWQVIEKVLALLTVQSLGVMRTLALSMDHVVLIRVLQVVQRQAPVSVSIAGAGSTDNHVRDGVVVLFTDLLTVIQQVISQRVQLGEVDSQIGHLQHVLDVLRIGILNVHVWRQDTQNDLSVLRGLHTGVPLRTNDISYVLGDSGHMRERLLAVVGKVLVHMPSLSEVIRPLDEHSSRSERGKHDDHVGEMELSLKIQLDRHILLSILRLPPGLLQSARLVLVDDLTDPMILHGVIFGSIACVAQEALGLLQMGHDTVTLWSVDTTGGGGLQTVLTSDQKVSCGRVAGTLLARVVPVLWALGCEG